MVCLVDIIIIIITIIMDSVDTVLEDIAGSADIPADSGVVIRDSVSSNKSFQYSLIVSNNELLSSSGHLQ